MKILMSTRRHESIVQEMSSNSTQKITALTDQLKAAEEGAIRLRHSVAELIVNNNLMLQQEEANYVGNEYKTYDKAVEAIDKKYRGEADWGVLQVATIIELRSAFILGEGPKVRAKTKTRAEAQKELDFCKAFFEYNGLDYEMAQENTKEGELEGKVALRLFYDDKKFREFPGMVSVRFISWLDKRYEVEADANDYLWYKKLTWKAQGTTPAGNVDEAEFVYKKFGGRIAKPNEAQPRVARCLSQIDRLDKALRDLREINHLFASPTADFQVEDGVQATQLLELIAKINWRIGKAIAHVGKFSLVSPDMSGVANLIAEIEMLMKVISGCVSIPIHYLGLLDLLKNRATGDNTRELIMAATTKERQIWTGAYNELIEKAMVMYNEKTGTGQKSSEGGRLDPTKVEVVIPQITEEHWNHIRDIFLPAVDRGVIDKETAAAQIPGVDLEEEREKAKVREQAAADQAQEELERIKLLAAANGNKDKSDDKEPLRSSK